MAYRILVTGASIAGSTLAWWLTSLGHEVTVVERAPAFRDGGQNIDVRDSGRDVLRRMGMEARALAAGTGETGTAWIDAQGRTAVWFAMETATDRGPTAELEILRGDLARLLFEAARDRARFRFGDHVTCIADDGGGVTVTFASDQVARYDLVVVAEGVGSATRERVFSGENAPRWMGLTLAYFTIARADSDDPSWRWYHTTGGRSISLRPDPHGTTRVMLGYRPSFDEERAPPRSPAQQKALLRERFADAGWQAPRVLEGLESTNDFYFDTLRQVHMPRWSKGRVALTGDAAWCPTPLAGIGATLAITGAFVLAQELSRNGDIATALARYESAMRPMVDQAQGVPKIAPKLMNPESRAGIRLLHHALRLASRPGARHLAGKLLSRRPRAPDLSAYDAPLPPPGIG